MAALVVGILAICALWRGARAIGISGVLGMLAGLIVLGANPSDWVGALAVGVLAFALLRFGWHVLTD